MNGGPEMVLKLKKVLQTFIMLIWANLSTKWDSNQPAQLQELARKLKFHL